MLTKPTMRAEFRSDRRDSLRLVDDARPMGGKHCAATRAPRGVLLRHVRALGQQCNAFTFTCDTASLPAYVSAHVSRPIVLQQCSQQSFIRGHVSRRQSRRESEPVSSERSLYPHVPERKQLVKSALTKCIVPIRLILAQRLRQFQFFCSSLKNPPPRNCGLRAEPWNFVETESNNYWFVKHAFAAVNYFVR